MKLHPMKSKKYLLSSYYLSKISDKDEYVVTDPILYEEIKKYLPSAKINLEPIYKVSRKILKRITYKKNYMRKIYLFNFGAIK